MRKKYNVREEPIAEIDVEMAWVYTSMANTMGYVLIDQGHGILEAIPIDLGFIEE